MIEKYALLGLFAFAALTFPVAPLLIAKILGPKKPNKSKLETYECGLEFEDFSEEAQNVWVQFRVQYYIIAILFVVFDIEVVFLYPWAVALNTTLGVPGSAASLVAFAEMFVFVGILVVALAYAWRKGLLEWN